MMTYGLDRPNKIRKKNSCSFFYFTYCVIRQQKYKGEALATLNDDDDRLSRAGGKLWVTDLLRCADRTLYCGVTNDINLRLEAHNSGKASRYTRCRLPVKLVCRSAPVEKSEALRLERAIKLLPRRMKIKALRGHYKEAIK